MVLPRLRHDPVQAGEKQFNNALIGWSLVFTAAVAAGGLVGGVAVMSPVSELAQRLRGPGAARNPKRWRRISPTTKSGQLAAALDDYAMRLTHVVQRDREFNADVSHELRTPLAVIKGAVELLLSRPERRRQGTRAPAAHPARRAAMHRPDQRAAAAVAQRTRPWRGGCRAHRRATAGRAPRAAGRQAVELLIEGERGLVVDAPEAAVTLRWVT
jgi:signal transduction histidine kinase